MKGDTPFIFKQLEVPCVVETLPLPDKWRHCPCSKYWISRRRSEQLLAPGGFSPKVGWQVSYPWGHTGTTLYGNAEHGSVVQCRPFSIYRKDNIEM